MSQEIQKIPIHKRFRLDAQIEGKKVHLKLKDLQSFDKEGNPRLSHSVTLDLIDSDKADTQEIQNTSNFAREMMQVMENRIGTDGYGIEDWNLLLVTALTTLSIYRPRN